jgi:hypothetical protein
MDLNNEDSPIIFDCQHFSFDSEKYQFENIIMNNFVLKDLEINNKDIALIKIM